MWNCCSRSCCSPRSCSERKHTRKSTSRLPLPSGCRGPPPSWIVCPAPATPVTITIMKPPGARPGGRVSRFRTPWYASLLYVSGRARIVRGNPGAGSEFGAASLSRYNAQSESGSTVGERYSVSPGGHRPRPGSRRPRRCRYEPGDSHQSTRNQRQSGHQNPVRTEKAQSRGHSPTYSLWTPGKGARRPAGTTAGDVFALQVHRYPGEMTQIRPVEATHEFNPFRVALVEDAHLWTRSRHWPRAELRRLTGLVEARSGSLLDEEMPAHRFFYALLLRRT